MESILSGGQRVLLTWGEGQDPEGIKTAVERLNTALGQNGKLQVENIERLALGKIDLKLVFLISFFHTHSFFHPFFQCYLL